MCEYCTNARNTMNSQWSARKLDALQEWINRYESGCGSPEIQERLKQLYIQHMCLRMGQPMGKE